MNLNKVFLIGRITANPEIRKTPSGQSVTNFTVATNRVWTNKDGSKQQETEFHNVVVWGRQAEIANQFLNKGSIVFIEGRLKTRNWQNKEGITRYVTEIICERLQLGPRPVNQNSSYKNLEVINSQELNNNEFQNIDPIQDNGIPVIDLEEEKSEEDLPF
ncbi:MAG: single-stranded DNA-binding protein [Patescibacteria group bacterium]|nr:single-stranded DNA-binding protein [Patescibacteria group bacterium]